MKKTLIWLCVFALLFGTITATLAADDEALEAAEELHELGLFSGVGTNEDGTPDFDLDRAPTRHEAVTMLVRLLGKEAEALAGDWETPFTDVKNWAKPYVGYAYANKLTYGTGETTFGGEDPVSATQYLTFVLRALGYESGMDFKWNAAWELSDAIGMTDGRYNAGGDFLRGDVAIISRNALYVPLKDGSRTLIEALGLAAAEKTEAEEPRAWYEVDENGKLYIRTNLNCSDWNGYTVMVRWNFDEHSMSFDYQMGFGSVVTYYCTSVLSLMIWQPAGTEVRSTDFIVLDDSDILAQILQCDFSKVTFEDLIERYSSHVTTRFVLDSRIRMELTEDAIELTDFSLTLNDDGTETYMAEIEGEILPDGDYGAFFRRSSDRQLTALSYLRREGDKLGFTREQYHFAPSGTAGTFYVLHCTYSIIEDGDIVCAVTQSGGVPYTLP